MPDYKTHKSEMDACDEIAHELRDATILNINTWFNQIIRRDFEAAEITIVIAQRQVADLLQQTQFCESRLK